MAKKKSNNFGEISEEERISRYLDYLEMKDELVKNYSSSHNHSSEDDMMSTDEWIERLYMD